MLARVGIRFVIAGSCVGSSMMRWQCLLPRTLEALLLLLVLPERSQSQQQQGGGEEQQRGQDINFAECCVCNDGGELVCCDVW